jgi:tRNA (guanine-N7-)-methyltransferase
MVHSSQAGVHPRLGRVLARHQAAPWQGALHAPTVHAFARLRALVGRERRPLVLDSGCGTGESTRRLAEAFPEALVIGADKSAARLARTGATRFPFREGNAVWLRADLATFWRLARDAGWRPQRHFLLYPNPWPKPGHLQRRWHAHPVFPCLLALGGQLEMRTNWAIYAQEFAWSAAALTRKAIEPCELPPGDALSPFERKYRASGHTLYSVEVPSPSVGRAL